MSETADHDLSHLPLAAARLGYAAARPRLVAIVCIVALSVLGWLYLGVIQVGDGKLFGAICRSFPRATFDVSGSLLVFAMWGAMVLAMMLPSAAPMILTYAEIAETATRKHEPVISPVVLTSGYAAVWLGFAATTAIAQIVLSRAALLTQTASVGSLFAGALFAAAGLYQFSSLKQACLRQCRSPFPFFFTNWATTARGVFRLGVKQGLFCLGCCWAAMLLMFALGVMNVLWMALLAIVMTIEKLASGTRLSYGIGAVFVVIGLGFVLSGFGAHWPPRPT